MAQALDADASGRIEVRGSRVRIALALLACLVFVAISVLLLAVPEWFVESDGGWRDSRAGVLIIGAVGLLFFGFATYALIRQLWTLGAPLVVLDDQGILDARWGIGPIPWSAVRGASIWRFHKSELVALDLVDAKAWTAKLSGGRRRGAGLNKKLGWHPFMISLSLTKVKPNELVSEIQRRARAPQVASAEKPSGTLMK
jgi:hypothetical protein